MLRARVPACLLVASAAACARPPSELQVTPLAEGEWVVAGHAGTAAILQQTRDIQPRASRGAPEQLPRLAALRDSLTPLPVDTFTVSAGANPIGVVRIGAGRMYAAATGQPRFLPSPTDTLLYAIEQMDGIWVFKAPDEMHKLTLDDDRDTLITRQREGAVILYWSARPVWSADGKFIAFLTNREAVRARTRGQSMWAIDAYTGIQGPLVRAPGQSVSTEGVLGEEFVFISDAQPGVFAVHPRTRAIRKLGDGYVLAGHARGRALLLNENGRLRLLKRDASVNLPAPPTGYVWSTQAAISPSGKWVAVLSTDQAGVYMLHVMDGESALPPFRLPGPPSQGPSWLDDASLTFSVQERGTLRTYRARLR
ncbi:MAG TPA: hypothetical protein VGC44_13645 [Longimicrobiales bacterium]